MKMVTEKYDSGVYKITDDTYATTELPPPKGTVDEEVRRIWSESERRANRSYESWADKMRRELP